MTATNRVDELIRERMMSEEFLSFINNNKAPYEEMMAYYRCAIMEIETKFNVLNEEFSLQYDRNPIESIKSRIKSPESIVRKLRNRQLPYRISAIEDNIFDIAGVRVICSFPEDIYLLADCLLRQSDITLIAKKDYIADPKENGYRSLHLIVEVPIFLKSETRLMKVEVQLRTIAMDFWASLEHKLRYKKDLPEELSRQLERELYECAEVSAALDLRMEKIKHRISDPECKGHSQERNNEQ